jgi:hypothetical protein
VADIRLGPRRDIFTQRQTSTSISLWNGTNLTESDTRPPGMRIFLGGDEESGPSTWATLGASSLLPKHGACAVCGTNTSGYFHARLSAEACPSIQPCLQSMYLSIYRGDCLSRAIFSHCRPLCGLTPVTSTQWYPDAVMHPLSTSSRLQVVTIELGLSFCFNIRGYILKAVSKRFLSFGFIPGSCSSRSRKLRVTANTRPILSQ